MLILDNTGRSRSLITKDGNKLGKRKRSKVIQDLVECFSWSNVIYVDGYNKYNKEDSVWSVYRIDDVNYELNDYLLTFKEATELIDNEMYKSFHNHNEDESLCKDNFVIYVSKGM